MPSDEITTGPANDDAPSSPPSAGRSGDPAFLSRPHPGEGPAAFTRRFLEALLGKDDARVRDLH